MQYVLERLMISPCNRSTPSQSVISLVCFKDKHLIEKFTQSENIQLWPAVHSHAESVLINARNEGQAKPNLRTGKVVFPQLKLKA